MYRSLVVLTIAQSFAMTGPPIVVLLGGIVGAKIAPSPSLATLPVAFMIVGTALTTVPAALFMARVGRKPGFLAGLGYASVAGIVGAYAISQGLFWLFCVATLLVGSNQAFVQQYRFAVAESVPAERVGPSLSILMLAGVVAAFLGPEVASRMHYATATEFAGSFLGLAGLMLVAFLCMLFYSGSRTEMAGQGESPRSLAEIAMSPLFILAIGAAVAGYAVMSLIMTATPVSMHTMDHFSLEDTKWVIQSHIVAMYLPSLFSGFLIARFGPRRIIGVGLALLFVCLATAYADRELLHYWFALVLLGVGWNFLFLGGTTLLTTTYRENERFKAQAFNDFLVFGLQAIAALGSGAILSMFGWHWVIGLSLPWLILLLPVMWIARVRGVAT